MEQGPCAGLRYYRNFPRQEAGLGPRNPCLWGKRSHSDNAGRAFHGCLIAKTGGVGFTALPSGQKEKALLHGSTEDRRRACAKHLHAHIEGKEIVREYGGATSLGSLFPISDRNPTGEKNICRRTRCPICSAAKSVSRVFSFNQVPLELLSGKTWSPGADSCCNACKGIANYGRALCEGRRGKCGVFVK